jgi:hypothetical protein
MAKRLISTDTDVPRLPEEMRTQLAADLADPATPEGVAIAALVPRIEVDPDGVPVIVIGE